MRPNPPIEATAQSPLRGLHHQLDIQISDRSHFPVRALSIITTTYSGLRYSWNFHKLIRTNVATSIKDMMAQKAELERLISEATESAKADGIAKVRALMEEHDLTVADLRGGGTPKKHGTARKSSGSKVAAKYRNESTGETWTGRGLQPRWLKSALASGKKLADFAI